MMPARRSRCGGQRAKRAQTHQSSNALIQHRVGNLRGARFVGIGVKRSLATNEVGKRAGCIPPPEYTPSYTHVSWLAVVLLLTRAPRHRSFSRTHEASR